MIVIIPCGAKKLNRAAFAKEMYVGSYHRMCQRYARSIAHPDSILILSAKHGLLRFNDEIEPYSLTLGEPGCVSVSYVRSQAQALGLLGEDVIAIGGKKYTGLCRQVWPKTQTPLQDNVKGGNGKQMGWMKSQL